MLFIFMIHNLFASNFDLTEKNSNDKSDAKAEILLFLADKLAYKTEANYGCCKGNKSSSYLVV